MLDLSLQAALCRGGVPSRGGAFGVLYTALVSECVASPFLCMEQRAEAGRCSRAEGQVMAVAASFTGIRAYPCLPAARLLSR